MVTVHGAHRCSLEFWLGVDYLVFFGYITEGSVFSSAGRFIREAVQDFREVLMGAVVASLLSTCFYYCLPPYFSASNLLILVW